MEISPLRILIAFLVTLFFSLLIKEDIKAVNVRYNGEIVEAKIIDKFWLCSAKSSRNSADILVNGTEYFVDLTKEECMSLNVGDKISVRYLKGVDKVTRPNENVKIELISGCLIYFFILLSIFYSGWNKYEFKKINKGNVSE